MLSMRTAKLDDIFAVQDDIAQSVVKELRAALLGEKQNVSVSAAVKAEVQAAAKGRGDNAEAYRLYLQGRFFEDRLTREDTAKAIEHYRQALEIDPQYALAWTGLSRAYGQQAEYGGARRPRRVSARRERPRNERCSWSRIWRRGTLRWAAFVCPTIGTGKGRMCAFVVRSSWRREVRRC